MKDVKGYKSYERYSENMTLNDHLSVDRTELANKRTLLSYLRTVVSFIVAAITLGQILVRKERMYVLVILLVSAFIFKVYGIYNYIKVARKLKSDKYR